MFCKWSIYSSRGDLTCGMPASYRLTYPNGYSALACEQHKELALSVAAVEVTVERLTPKVKEP